MVPQEYSGWKHWYNFWIISKYVTYLKHNDGLVRQTGMGYNSYAIEAFAQIYILWNDELHTFLYFAIYTTVAMQAGIEMAPVWQDQFSKDSCSVFAAWAPVRPEWHHEHNNSWDSDVQVVPSPGLISGRFHQLYRWGSWGIRKWLLWLCNLSLVLKLQIPWFFLKVWLLHTRMILKCLWLF